MQGQKRRSRPVLPNGKPPPPRIVLFTSHVSDEYEWTIASGVRLETEALGGTVVCLAGGALGDPNPELQRQSYVFRLVNPEQLDGAIAISSVVGQYVGHLAMGDFLRGIPLPTCSVGRAGGIPSTLVDDAAGMVHLLEHLVDHHDHRRIAFVSGPLANPEAQSRLETYINFMHERGLRQDPKLVTEGGFTRETGERAVRELLDTRQVRISDIDAIVASNDHMAFGVIDELMRRRISVPEHVAVVGFDDVALARVYRPALTTVRQPLEELGRSAARSLFALLEGKEVEPVVRLESELLLRRSCGCAPTEPPPAPSDQDPLSRPFSELNREAWDNDLVEALLAEANGANGAFARALDPFLKRLVFSGVDPGIVYDLFPSLRRRAVARLGEDQRGVPEITSALQRGRRLAEDLALRSRLLRHESFGERLHRFARALEARMYGPQSQLSTVMVEHLPELGIEECVVSELGATEGELRLAFGFDKTQVQPKPEAYPAIDLAPPEFRSLASKSIFVLPVRFGDQLLGVTVIPLCHEGGPFYETLAEVFGIVLKGVEIRRKLKTP